MNTIPKKHIMLVKKLENFNHFDFIWGMNASEHIYSEILNIAKEHSLLIDFNLSTKRKEKI